MNILHICNDFAGSKVHINLVKRLDERHVNQLVYCPVRDARLIGKNKVDCDNAKVFYSFCIKSWYKYVYHYKAHILYNDLKKHIDVNSADIIHAHTLFSDGVLAYFAKKEFGIPYVVAVRNTDVNTFLKLLKHTHGLGRKIVLHAERVFFISAALKTTFEESHFIQPILDKVKDKFVLQPNGIDDYWHNHISHEERNGSDILYIGDFSANKNIVRLAKAILNLRREKGFENTRLILVGGEVSRDAHNKGSKTQSFIDANPDAIKALGKIYDKDRLTEVMRSCSLFAMTSIHETFGLVYLEALSQNLPVIYTRGQGIDGMFDETVGIGVNPLSIDETMIAIKNILNKHSKFGNGGVNFSDFKWARIAESYSQEYNKIIES